ncbi:MAG: AAA family ATPase, partial [Thermomicrobiales bacterium]
ADRERVLPVVEALRSAGVTVWLDQQGIAGGANYGAEIADAIKNAAALALMCSAASLASRNVKQEVALAWRFERPYVPLLLEAVTIPDDLAYWLEASQWVEVFDKPKTQWLPAALAALRRVGIAPARPADAPRKTATSDAPVSLITIPEPPPLVGREREQAVLRERLAAAHDGRGAVVLIGGEAGMGKTALAASLAHEAARQGALVLDGHSYDLAETPPYGPWVDLFARYPTGTALAPPPDAFAQRGTVGAVASQMALFVQVQDFLRALTMHYPVVLLLDDLHWADPASLDLLRFLARSVSALPLLILVTYRSDELTRRHPLYQLLPSLVRDAAAERVDLHRLDDEAVRALIDARYGLAATDAARLAAYLQSRAEGNALFVGELLRSLAEAGALHREDAQWTLGDLAAIAVPALLRQVIDGRLARLGDETQRLLAVAAIIGHEVPLAVWAAVGEVDEDGLLDTVEQATEARLLIEAPDGARVQFAHALIREALYEGVTATRRRRIHRRVGEALASARDPDPDAVAYHFQQAGDDRAATWLVKAGERAQLAYARLTAAERYEAALALLDERDGDLGERGWLRYRIARVRRYSTPQQSIEYLDEALRIADAVVDRALAAAARYSRGLCLLYLEDADSIAEMAAGCDALEALSPEEQAQMDLGPDEQGLSTIANARGFLVAALAGSGRIAEAIAMGEAARDGKPRNTPLADVAWDNYGDRDAGLAEAYALAGRPDDARAAYERTRTCYREVGNVGTGDRITVEMLLVWFPYYADRPGELERLANEAEDTFRRSNSPIYERIAHLPVLALAGRWAETREGAEAALLRTWGQRAFRKVPLLVLSDISRAQGEVDAAWSLIREALPSEPATLPDFLTWPVGPALLQAPAQIALDAGDLTTAQEWLEIHGRWLAWSGAMLGQSEGQALWAQYHRQAGEIDKAREHAGRALAHASEPRQPLALIAAHRLLGELDTEAGRYDDAETHLNASLALATACEAPFERALTLLAMAQLRSAMGDTTDATVLLAEVRAICTPLGAKPTLARVDALAATMG